MAVDKEKLKEHLRTLSTEQLLDLQLQLAASDPSSGDYPRLAGVPERTPHQAGMFGAAEGALLGLQGRPISELSLLQPKAATATDELALYEAKERVKGKIQQEEIDKLIGGGGDLEGRSGRVSSVNVGGRTIDFPLSEEQIQADLEREANAKARIKEKTDIVEQKTKIAMGNLVSLSNLETIAGVAHDLSNVFADSVREGGAGGFLQSAKSGIATRIGDLPGGIEVGGKFPASGAYPGKRQELILKMMPMLTQQATKPEGSIRLITGVLNAIGETIPEKGTAPKTARRQLEESLLSFYRFARTSELLGIEFDKFFADIPIDSVSDNDIQSWVDRVNSLSTKVKIEGTELDAVRNVIDESLSPLDSIINRSGKSMNQGVVKSFNSVAEAEAANLPRGTRILVGGRKAVIE